MTKKAMKKAFGISNMPRLSPDERYPAMHKPMIVESKKRYTRKTKHNNKSLDNLDSFSYALTKSR